MRSNNNNFIHFIQSTFLFVLNAPNQREKFKNSAVPHGIYTFEIESPAASVKLFSKLRLVFTVLVSRC